MISVCSNIDFPPLWTSPASLPMTGCYCFNFSKTDYFLFGRSNQKVTITDFIPSPTSSIEKVKLVPITWVGRGRKRLRKSQRKRSKWHLSKNLATSHLNLERSPCILVQKNIKPTISKPCITPEREIANNGNFRGYQTYSRGTLF